MQRRDRVLRQLWPQLHAPYAFVPVTSIVAISDTPLTADRLERGPTAQHRADQALARHDVLADRPKDSRRRQRSGTLFRGDGSRRGC